MFMYWDFDLLCTYWYLPGGRPASEATDNADFSMGKVLIETLLLMFP